MDDTIITTYYLCEEFLKAIGHQTTGKSALSTAEVMSIALLAAAFFGGNIEEPLIISGRVRIHKKAISKSRFNRRLHAIDPLSGGRSSMFLAEVFKHI